MAHLLKQKDVPEPGRWRLIRGDEAARWREAAREKLATRPRGSVVIEYDVGRHTSIEEAPTLNRETGIIERPKAEKPRAPMETIEVLSKMMLESILSGTEEQRLRRIQLLKAQTVGLDHLTDAEALDQVATLVDKLVRRDAERRYKEMGILNPAVIRGG